MAVGELSWDCDAWQAKRSTWLQVLWEIYAALGGYTQLMGDIRSSWGIYAALGRHTHLSRDVYSYHGYTQLSGDIRSFREHIRIAREIYAAVGGCTLLTWEIRSLHVICSACMRYMQLEWDVPAGDIRIFNEVYTLVMARWVPITRCTQISRDMRSSWHGIGYVSKGFTPFKSSYLCWIIYFCGTRWFFPSVYLWEHYNSALVMFLLM